MINTEEWVYSIVKVALTVHGCRLGINEGVRDTNCRTLTILTQSIVCCAANG